MFLPHRTRSLSGAPPEPRGTRRRVLHSVSIVEGKDLDDLDIDRDALSSKLIVFLYSITSYSVNILLKLDHYCYLPLHLGYLNHDFETKL